MWKPAVLALTAMKCVTYGTRPDSAERTRADVQLSMARTSLDCARAPVAFALECLHE